MATQLQLRRGTTSENASFTGAVGEVTVDTTKDTLIVQDGSTAGGHELAKADGTNISFGDNVKATFGASDDLQIYHDGSNSRIVDTGAGNLNVQGTNLVLSSATGSPYLQCYSGGTTALYHAGSPKLSTTATGIDVTGTATMDGLTVEGNGALFTLDNGSNDATLSNTNGNVVLNYDAAEAGRAFTVQQNGRNVLRVNNSGDVSFYEDTGTTPKLVWSSAAESLRLGSILPQTPALFNLRSNGTNIEFGHANRVSGYFGTLGASANNGLPYFGFSAHADGGTVNTFTTKGFKGNVIQGDASGNLTFNQLTNANASGQVLAERMRIDSSGDVNIGPLPTSTSKLNVKGSIEVAPGGANTTQTNTLLSTYGYNIGTTKYGQALLSSSYNHLSNRSSLNFATSSGGSATPTQRMSIDALGNASFNTTSISPSTSNVFGTAILQYGGASMSRTNSTTLDLNRSTSDGTIIQLRKDGTAVGSIGVVNTNNITIGGTVAGHAGIQFGTGTVFPELAGGAGDTLVDLGVFNQRFKDLWLSGGVYLGGTGAANKLDSYEEGTWTPSIVGSTSGTATVNVVTNSYTKIGNTVRVDCYLNQSDVTGLSGSVRLSGLPFTGSGYSPITVTYCNLFSFNEATDTVSGFTESGAAYVNLTFGSASVAIPSTDADATNGTIMFQATYKTNS